MVLWVRSGLVCVGVLRDIVIVGMGYNINSSVEISLWLLTGLFLSCLVITLGLAFLLSLAVEAPFIELEKLTFGVLLGTDKKSVKIANSKHLVENGVKHH